MRVFDGVSVAGGSGSGICARLAAPTVGTEVSESPEEQGARLKALDWEPPKIAGAPEVLGAVGQLWRDMLKEMRERSAQGEFRSAEEAVRCVGEELRRELTRTDSPYLRERAADIAGIERQMLSALRSRPSPGLRPGDVLVAEELTVLTAIEAARAGAAAVLTRAYGPLSHAAIVLRSGGIPVAHGFSSLEMFEDGARVLVDGWRGQVILEPDECALRAAALESLVWTETPETVALSDGTRLHISLNCEGSWQPCPEGAEIGLLRSEFFYESLGRLPTEDELAREYAAVASGRRRTTIRLMDAGVDKPVPSLPSTLDPCLRGVRLLLKKPEILRTQLRAILRAAARAEVRILIPMVTSPEEIREVRAQMTSCAAELASEGVTHRGELAVGAMIETPSAAALADALAREADFASIGTNDLTHCVTMTPRSAAAEPSEAVLRLIGECVHRFDEAGKPIGVCGEMASDARWLPELVRLGVREVSVPPLFAGLVARTAIERL